ncbi:DsbA family protein [Shimazuella alba]|uniref:DsbA family protein n=1 Tax=Shimazuella alba TaxID=2690964 RepID=A0A6I4VQF7_9BACL|nr:DsbA family protein [Shimazuella alba]MXQ52631.1 DsbA family protein [Shimazuella alba]
MNKNNLICDVETGICGTSTDNEMEIIDFHKPKEQIKLYYFTDPICSHCWALEPVLRKFVEQYGHYFTFHTIMGGLLESWNGFADVKNGISSPSDVASHWKEVGEHSRMPIDGSLWLTNPIPSSYPPSRVFKIMKQKDENLANVFLRRAREAVFVFNKNIGEEKELIHLINLMGLDGETIVKEAELPTGQQLLNQDFEFAKSFGVRGFPTIIMVNEQNKGVKIVGTRTLKDYVNGLKKVLPMDIGIEIKPQQPLFEILKKEIRLFSKEVEVLYDLDKKQIFSFLEQELDSNYYDMKEILGEIYIEKKQPRLL